MSKKLIGGLIIVLLGLGLLAGLIAVQQSTETRQHASSIFKDLNTAGEIGKTNNIDGTMGPLTAQGNFSNTLPIAYLGSLGFGVTDPEQERRPDEKVTATPTLTPEPTHKEPSPTKGDQDKKPTTTPDITKTPDQGGPQAVSSLVITINKVELHLARLGIPGAKITLESEQKENPTATPQVAADNQNVDKWETLDIGTSKTVDLVVLAKNHDVSSLGITKLANGRYTEVRLYISTASAILANGTKVDLTIPGKANIVRVVMPFVITSGKMTMLSMDFDAQNSVIKVGNTYLFKPVVARFDQKNQE